jgi:4-aminobutyrate aminotransferase/(S)-3-amino-2-methylpropionate transaminase
LLKRAQRIGELVTEAFRGFYEKYPIVGDVRGIGAMIALELVENRANRIASQRLGDIVAEYAYQHGLILMRAGMHSHVIRTLLPLVISDEELFQGLAILDNALAYAASQSEANGGVAGESGRAILERR